MANLKKNKIDGVKLPRLFVDNGDGTYSEKLNVDFSGADFSGASITLASAIGIEDAVTHDGAVVVNADEAANSTKFGLLTRVVGLLGTLGAVTVSPTANTVLDRLKTVAANITTSITSIDAITTAVTALSTIVGAVTASPAANTVLDRLKTIGTLLAATLTVQRAEDLVALTQSVKTGNNASQSMLTADPTRKIVIVSSAAANAEAAVSLTGGTAALDAGLAVGAGLTATITGVAAQSAMTFFATTGNKLTVYTG